MNAVKVNIRSSLVNGVPSCHFTFGFKRQIVSMVPSALTRQVPRSTESCSAARLGTNSS